MDNDIRSAVLKEATLQFEKKGLKFTIQDIADQLHIAKKTIYHLFPSKEDLMIAMIEDGFEKIQKEKEKIIQSSLPADKKLRKVLIAFPSVYRQIDFGKLDGLDRYPTVAECLNRNLEQNWEPILSLMREGIEEGVFRKVDLTVFRLMITASFEKFLSRDGLEKEGIHYQTGLEHMVDIVMGGVQK